jgi:hypothetical protein
MRIAAVPLTLRNRGEELEDVEGQRDWWAD